MFEIILRSHDYDQSSDMRVNLLGFRMYYYVSLGNVVVRSVIGVKSDICNVLVRESN